jgi:ABC-type transport system involved in multi-copper enzyme maturation permease subunit
LIIASLYFTFLGISEYKSVFKDQEDFITAEKGKLKLYMNYEQYGATGFRVILEPSALMVFFSRSDFVRNIEANIDTSEIIRIYNERKGEKAFSVEGRFGDLNQSITVFGTLIMMMMGFLTFPNRHTIDFFSKSGFIKTILARLLLVNCFFLLFLFMVYWFARILGITFTVGENRVFLFYSAAVILMLDLFFTAGLFIKALFKYKKNAVISLLIAWFVFIFIIPEIGKVYRSMRANLLPLVEKLNLQKLETLLSAEQVYKKDIRQFLNQSPNKTLDKDDKKIKKYMKMLFDHYMNNGYLSNKEKEEDLYHLVKDNMETFASLNSLSPVDFLNVVAAEASGKGYTAYLDFLNYVMELRDRFMEFYGRKRYKTNNGEKINNLNNEESLESFIKKSENIYQSQSRLAETFEKGAAAAAFYITILSIGLALLHRKRKKTIATVKSPEISAKIQRDTILFVLANKDKQEALFRTLVKNNRANLHEYSHQIMNEAVTAARFIDFACRQKKIEKSRVMENLGIFHFKETDLQKKLSHVSVEDKKKLICAIVFAEEKEIIVLNDFIKAASREFEEQFLSLVARAAASGQKIVYIGSDMYAPASSFIKRDVKVKNYQAFQLEPQKISLR